MTDPGGTTGGPEYPSQHARADAASARTQRLYMRGVRVHLLLLLAAAAAGVAPADDRTAAVVVATTMFLSFVAQLTLKIARYDDRWFDARAVAENIKCAAWQYAMRSLDEQDSSNADDAFHDSVTEIERRLPDASRDLAREDADGSGSTITPWMRRTRAASLADRLTCLRVHRIEEQRRWYSAKAAENARAEEIWTWSTLAVEAVAVVIAVVQVAVLWPVSIGPVLAAAAAALVAWRQTKRFSDLGTTYRVAADDLGRLADVADRVTDEDGLRQLVAHVEAAISREHALWYQRASRG